MSSINIRRAVENIRSGTTIYTPVVELIVNAIQAIREIKNKNGNIHVCVIRSGQQDILDNTPAVDGFSVKDDGVGFNQVHRDSFDTLYTDRKFNLGGKGFGRFTCLKYFSKFYVESTFIDKNKYMQRKFTMGNENDIITNESLRDSDKNDTGSNITICGIRGIKFPDKGLDVIARVLVEKLLPYFIDQNSSCPRIGVKDSATGQEIILNDYINQANRQILELPVPNSKISMKSADGAVEFSVRIFKFYAPRVSKSKISLVAHRREVTDITIQTYIPEFADEFYDKSLGEEGGPDRNFILKTHVLGPYLDNNVSLERGGFNFQKDSDLVFGLSQSQIELAAAQITQDTVGDEIFARRERKNSRIKEYIDTEAPWHRELSNRVDFSSLPMNPGSQDIEVHLQKEKFRIEMEARAEIKKILSDGSGEKIKEQVAEIIKTISSTSKNDLIHYVSMRKCVLDLFGRSLDCDENGNYRSEGDVHDIIMPRRKDSNDLDYENHNLWILDERLNFSGYISSDKPLDGKKGDRTDITLFGRRIAFRGDNVASNPIIIFEFKKPGRHDFANPSSEEDPVQQVVRYVNDIRDGRYKTANGRDILVTDNTPFYGYVVCDLPSKVKRWLEREKEFTVMPDGLGYFRWNGNIKLYIEVLGWDKIFRDAEMRNKIFFHKLGIS